MKYLDGLYLLYSKNLFSSFFCLLLTLFDKVIYTGNSLSVHISQMLFGQLNSSGCAEAHWAWRHEDYKLGKQNLSFWNNSAQRSANIPPRTKMGGRTNNATTTQAPLWQEMWGERKTLFSLICYSLSTCLFLTKAALSLQLSVSNSQPFIRKELEILL